MQKWDALHAMLIYESLELRDSISDEPQSWKHDPRPRGLGSPFLVKVWRRQRFEHFLHCTFSTAQLNSPHGVSADAFSTDGSELHSIVPRDPQSRYQCLFRSEIIAMFGGQVSVGSMENHRNSKKDNIFRQHTQLLHQYRFNQWKTASLL